MTAYSNTAEGGTNGTTVTVANSGGASGDPWRGVTINAATTLTYATSAAYRGTLGYRLTASNTVPVMLSTTAVTADYLRLRYYLKMDALPNATIQHAQAALSSGGVGGYVYLGTDGRLGLVDAAGAITWTTNGIPTGQWVRVEVIFNPGSTTANGTAKLGYALGDGPILETLSRTGNYGTGTMSWVNFGKVSNAGLWTGASLDDIAWDTGGGATTFIGPSALNKLRAGANAIDLRLGTTRPAAVYVGTTPLWP